jgi:hypothetical protein
MQAGSRLSGSRHEQQLCIRAVWPIRVPLHKHRLCPIAGEATPARMHKHRL